MKKKRKTIKELYDEYVKREILLKPFVGKLDSKEKKEKRKKWNS